eukprot:Nitzschia sp. Nitz4//scaffold24_size164493//159213//159755//NITZ4_002356-RA/size164493-processed-gene-0.215-mRNA-1//1//CDS//3329544198//1350//frame0
MSLKYKIACLSLILFSVCADSDAEGESESFATKDARKMAKPWLSRKLELGGVTLPFTPATLIATLVVLVNLFYGFFTANQKWCQASHILFKDTSPKTHKALVAMVQEVGKDGRKFGLLAENYSQCPSKTQKGDLGKFLPGDMAPAFDRVCFDASTPEKTTIGPIQTNFGYHLIYIHQRKL